MPIDVDTGHIQTMTRAVASDAAAGPPASEISAIEQRWGWAKDGWQHDLMNRADTASTGRSSAAQVNAYLAEPTDGRFLTSNVLFSMQGATPANPVAVTSFEKPWQQTLAKLADQSPWGHH